MELTNLPVVPEKAMSDRIANLVAQAQRCVITDVASAERGSDLLKLLNTAAHKLEDHKKEVTGPINQALKAVRGRYKGPEEALATAIATVKRHLLAFQQRVAAEQAAQRERKRQEDLEKLANADLTPEAEDEAVAKLAQDEAVAAQERAPVVRGDFGSSASIRRRWTYRLVNIEEVPRGYMELNAPVINQAIRDGVREIPGLEIFEEETVVVR